jgi:hypothetical protein
VEREAVIVVIVLLFFMFALLHAGYTLLSFLLAMALICLIARGR